MYGPPKTGPQMKGKNLAEVLMFQWDWNRIIRDAYAGNGMDGGELNQVWRSFNKMNLAVDGLDQVQAELDSFTYEDWRAVCDWAQEEHADMFDGKDAGDFIMDAVHQFVTNCRIQGLFDGEIKWEPPPEPPPPPPPPSAWFDAPITEVGEVAKPETVDANAFQYWPRKVRQVVIDHPMGLLLIWVDDSMGVIEHSRGQDAGKIWMSVVVPMPDGSYKPAGKHIEVPSLGILIGADKDEDGNVYVVTALNENRRFVTEPKRMQHMYNQYMIHKFDIGGNLVRSQDIVKAIEPRWGQAFVNVSDIGNGDVLCADGKICVATAYYGNVARDGKRHTCSIYITLNQKDLSCHGRPKLGPSHSFNTRLVYHKGEFWYNDLGDAGMRGPVMGNAHRELHIKGPKREFNGKMYSTYSYRRTWNVWEAKGGCDQALTQQMRWKASQGDQTAVEALKELEAGYIYQETHCTGGNIVMGDESFVVVFSADHTPNTVVPKRRTAGCGPQNIGLVNISLDCMENPDYWKYDGVYEGENQRPWIIQDRNPNLKTYEQKMFTCIHPARSYMAPNPAVFLTDHTDIEVSSAAHPRIRRIGDDYIIIWMESKFTKSKVSWHGSGARQGMKALICDEWGNIKKPAQWIQDPNFPQKPLFDVGNLPAVAGDRLVWAVAGDDEFDGLNIIHSLDLDLNLKSSLME